MTPPNTGGLRRGGSGSSEAGRPSSSNNCAGFPCLGVKTFLGSLRAEVPGGWGRQEMNAGFLLWKGEQNRRGAVMSKAAPSVHSGVHPPRPVRGMAC